VDPEESEMVDATADGSDDRGPQSPRGGRLRSAVPELREHGSAEDDSTRELVDKLLDLADLLRARARDLDPQGKMRWMETASWGKIADWAGFMHAVGEELGT
jgi:hypothetical protein